MSATATENGYKKCRITLVTPGSSDRVIDVYPAEHETEKIWLDNTPGIERWEAVDRLMNNFAERGTRVPQPAKWHNDGKFNRPDLNEADIPLVRLDGAVLKALPKPETVPIRAPINQADVDARFKFQNEKIDALATAISNLAVAMTKKEAPVTESGKVPCPKCDKEFKNANGLRLHSKSHKS